MLGVSVYLAKSSIHFYYHLSFNCLPGRYSLQDRISDIQDYVN